jgi:aminoglycoside phosphotransferase (APT) family kinase protein
MARWLRREQQVYTSLRASFLPRVLGVAEGDAPILLLEDLSDAHWPPPWRAGDVEAVLAALEELRRLEPPPDTPTLTAYESGIRERWQTVADDPGPFLSLGLVDRDWLTAALPTIVEAAEAVPLEGDDLLHLDVRSDNLCLRDGRPVLVDWNHVCTGNGLFDVAAFLPSVAAEGGPQPHELAPEAGPLAVVVAGYFASVAGLPSPAFAPTVRVLQVAQLVPALAWMRRELGL